MSLIITDAGIAAAIRAGDLGIEYKIAHISIGSAGYIPNPAQTELVNEIQRKAITRGDLVAPGQLHFETVWDGSDEFEGKELGYWLDDGTLFAVDSRNGEVITYKRKNTVVTEACELNLSASTISNITVELLGQPYATESVAGIAKIATKEQVTQGTDDSAFLTVTKFLHALDVSHVINKLVNNLWLKLAARIYPVGSPIPWFTDIAPDGFGMFKGQAFDIETYTELAKVYPNGI
ncbi:MAG: phage tail protein, partial [Vibrio sp.]